MIGNGLALTALAARQGRGAVAPPPDPAWAYASYNDVPQALMGFCTQPSAGRWNMTGSAQGVGGAMFAYAIKASAANMLAFAGDTTPYRVLVDLENFAAYSTPTLSGGKIPLFSGQADAWHTVFIWADNSASGQGFPAPTGNLIEAFGSNAQVKPLSAKAWRLTDPAFPGVATGLRNTSSYFPAGIDTLTGEPGYGFAANSIHCRARGVVWVYCDKAADAVLVSINGGLGQVVSLSALDAGAQTTGGWRKLLMDPLTSYAELIITGAGSAAGNVNGKPLIGIMVVGEGADLIAPSNTAKRHVTLLGASQVEGVVNGAGGFVNYLAQAQNRLPIFLLTLGKAGATLPEVTAAIPIIAPKIQYKKDLVVNAGINSTDDGTFQPAVQAVVQAGLDAGWENVIIQGLITTFDNTSKNAKNAAAVASFALPNVKYASVATWTATTNGAGGSIKMPDGSHPDLSGYTTYGDLWVRDHAGLFAA